MNESQLTELLERVGEQTEVGPPPLDALRAGATRRRRRRATVVSLATAAAVVAVVGGVSWISSPGTSPKSPAAPAASAPTGTGTGIGPVPAGMRLVGIGRVAVAVPEAWPTNKENCGTPMEDTIMIDRGGMNQCQQPRPSGVESVELTEHVPWYGFHSDETIVIGGVPAKRQRTVCIDDKNRGDATCSGAVYFPSLNVWIRADSSDEASEVDRLLGKIRIVADRAGVPGFQGISPDRPERSAAIYVNKLRGMGLKAVIKPRPDDHVARGTIWAVSPAPGTMLSAGETVTVTVVG
jgi:hypothetical protein